MPTNDFKPFAIAAGANVLSQADYNALAAVSTGWQSGVAKSTEVNKAVRQATFIASAVAQYVADLSGQDVLDDGNIANFIAKLKTANGSQYLTRSSNLADITNATIARSSLGLKGAAILDTGTTAGTVAAGDDSRITGALQKGNNLSDLTSATTARTSLGLKGGAILDVGTTAGTLAAGDDSRINNALQKANNLSELSNATIARSNLGLKALAIKDSLSASDVSAVPVTGGNAAFINNAAHFGIAPGTWEGAGGFADQFSSPAAPFVIPQGYAAPNGTSQYNPIMKAIIQTRSIGFAAAVSFGTYTSGGNAFPSAIIQILGDSGANAVWSFDPNGVFTSQGVSSGKDISATGNITASGNISTSGTGSISSANDISAGGKITSGSDIKAGGGVFESGGNFRVYSPNNIPTPEVIGAIRRDSCDLAGFFAANSQAPYMRNSANGANVNLATQNWVQSNFVNSIRLTGRTVVPDTGGRIDLPVGCVYTGMSGSNYNPATWGAYSVIQQLVNNSWVTVGAV